MTTKQVRSRRPIFPSDVQRLGGRVSIVPSRDRVDGSITFIVEHISRGGDIHWSSAPIMDEAQAQSAAAVLARYVGATVR
ncbi:hypothetical protein ABIB90_000521 [Bradyrhizobium sp. JR4.1]